MNFMFYDNHIHYIKPKIDQKKMNKIIKTTTMYRVFSDQLNHKSFILYFFIIFHCENAYCVKNIEFSSSIIFLVLEIYLYIYALTDST